MECMDLQRGVGFFEGYSVDYDFRYKYYANETSDQYIVWNH